MKNEKWDDVHGNTTPDDRMVAFLESPTDSYAILQLREDVDDNIPLMFANYSYLQKKEIQCQHTARRAAAIAAPDVFVCVDVEPPALVSAKGAVQVQARRQTAADGKPQKFYHIGNAKRKRIGR